MDVGQPNSPSLLFLYDGEYGGDNGVSSYIRTIGEYVANQGVAVEYMVGKNSSDEPHVISPSKSVAVRGNGSTSFVPLYTPKRHITHELERIQPDAVHVQLPFASSMSGQVIKQLGRGTSLVGTFHTPMPHGWLRAANQVNARVTRNEMKRFDQFFSVSEAAQIAAKTIYNVDSEILPCPINLEQAQNNIDISNYDTNKTTVSFLGRLTPRKGAMNFITGLELVKPTLQDQLAIQLIGDGEERQHLEQRVIASTLHNKTHFTGKVTGIPKYNLLAKSDIVVCPSVGGESFGIILLEAMATQRPVVLASNINGYSEVMRDVPEALIAKDDPTVLARRIETLIDDPSERQRIFHAQQEVVNKFDIRQIIGPALMKAYGFTGEGTQ